MGDKLAVVISLSGGLDSAVLCAALLQDHGPGRVSPVFFRYGSKHNPWEERAARSLASYFSLILEIVDMANVFSGVSSVLMANDNRTIPLAQYDTASMAQTVVPGRNLLFASVLAALAESRGIPDVALATHGGDHHIYPDCRPEFNAALDRVIACSSDGKVRVITPFADISKADIVARGLQLGVPFHLTRSCYGAAETSCGECGTCSERLSAFAANGAQDPVLYRKKLSPSFA